MLYIGFAFAHEKDVQFGTVSIPTARGRKLKKIKVGIFGTGFMGRVHTEALRRLGNIEVIGVAGRTLEVTQRFANELGIERATADYNELLAERELQAVHICTPNSLHFPMAKAAG